MKKYGVCVLALLLAAGFSAQSLAAQAPAQPASRPGLTQDQIAKRKAGRDANQAAQKARFAQMKSLTGQLRAELKKKPADQARIKYLRDQLDIQRETMRLQILQNMLNNPNIKPAARQRLNSNIQKIKDRIARKQSAK